MNLPLRHSITEVVRVWDTNINPVQVIADDVKDYVAKHNRGQAPYSGASVFRSCPVTFVNT